MTNAEVLENIRDKGSKVLKPLDPQTQTLIYKTREWVDILNQEHIGNYPEGWEKLREVQLAHILILEDLVSKTYTPPNFKRERGIIIGTGGAKFFSCAFAAFYTLKRLKCSVPIEFWYLGDYEMDDKMKEICDMYNITYINTEKFCKDKGINLRILSGWELKSIATLFSDFKEVMYIDADNIPAIDPSYLFDDPRYKELGSIFWPDLPSCEREEWLVPLCWHNVNLEYIKEVDFESGQFIVNKEKCYKELYISYWINQHSDWFYKFVYGDKSTFHLAWRKCGTDYGMPSKPAGWEYPCILQYDLDDRLVFQHACQGKELIYSGTKLSNIINGNYVNDAKKMRDLIWSGIIYSWDEMPKKVKKISNNLVGKYEFIKENLSKQTIHLIDGGDIGKGKSQTINRWSLKVENDIVHLILIGSAHKGSEVAMVIAKDDGSGKCYNGKLSAYEKCNVTLKLIN